MADGGKTTIINTDRGGGSRAIALLAIAIIAVAIVLFLLVGQNLMDNTKTVDANVKIDTLTKN